MPELPEVETVVRGLEASLRGRRILEVRFGKTDFIEEPAALEQDLPGKEIQGVRRYGKFVILELASTNGNDLPGSLLIHLGMTGQLTVCRADARIVPHTHAFFRLDDGRELRYTDIRRFGRIQLVGVDRRAVVLGALGLDPLEASEEEFRDAFSSRRARIKALLLDQHVLRGMGNIYTDESLWRARIHPMQLAASLSPRQLGRLCRAVRSVLQEAIHLRGSSISDYVDSEGQPGEFQRRHRVYQREGKKCRRCRSLIRRVTVAGRSSYFCPSCQPAPRSRRRGRRRSRPIQRQRAIRTAPSRVNRPA